MQLVGSLEGIVHLHNEGEVDTLKNAPLSHRVFILLFPDDLLFLENL